MKLIKCSALLAALALLFSLGGCSKEEKEAEPVALVQVAQATQEPIQRIVTGEGLLRALDQAAIVPKISAPVAQFFVNRGDLVKKDQVLARLENRDLAATVADARGAYEQAAANYRNISTATVPDEVVKAEADLQAAKQTTEATKKVLDNREELLRQGALARKLVDDAAVSYAQAKGQYETALKHFESLQKVGRLEEVKGAQGQMDSAKGKYDAAVAQLSYSEIHSPISGTVADRPVFPGEMATAGTPLITVVDTSSVIARVNLPVAQATFLRRGQSAHIRSDDSGAEVDGKVTVVSPAVDAQSTTVEIWAQAANPGGRLRPGGAVHVTVDAGTVPNAVVVPTAALLSAEDGSTMVLVVGSDSTVHQHKVEIGVRGSDKVQILGGVAAGDQVVVAGGVGLEDGKKVKIGKPGEGEKTEAGGKSEGGEKEAEKPEAGKKPAKSEKKAGQHE